LRRIVGNKVSHQFCRNELCRRWMMRKDVEHHQAVFDSAPRRNLVAQHDLLAVVVNTLVEEERTRIATCAFTHHRIHCGSTAAWLEDGPTRKTSRDFLHVFLRVATIDAECVQFHQLARVVLIDTASLSLWLLFCTQLLQQTTSAIRIRVWTDTLKVIEIEQHRRALRRALQ